MNSAVRANVCIQYTVSRRRAGVTLQKIGLFFMEHCKRIRLTCATSQEDQIPAFSTSLKRIIVVCNAAKGLYLSLQNFKKAELCVQYCKRVGFPRTM